LKRLYNHDVADLNIQVSV